MKRFWKWLLLVAVLILSVTVYRSWRLRHPFAFALGQSLPNGTVQPQLLSGGGSAVLLAPDGTLWGWGADDCFPEGRTDRPVRLGADADWTAIAGSSGFLLARKADGSLWSRGPSFYDRQAEIPRNPFQPVRVGADNDWTLIATTGMGGAFALKKSGTLWAWGRFDNDTGFDRVPKEIGTEPDAVAIVGDIISRYVLRRDGTIWFRTPRHSTTGEIRFLLAQLGTESDWAGIYSSGRDFIARKKDGTLWSGGAGASFNAVLEGQPVAVGHPKRVGTDADWSEAYDGDNCYFARKRDGSWWVSGENLDGRLGFSPHGAQWGFNTPEKLPFTFDPWAFAAGGKTTLFLARDGSLWSWGKQLGQPPPSARDRAFKTQINAWSGRLSWRPKPFPDPETTWNYRPRKIWQWKPNAMSGGAGNSANRK